MNKRKFEVALMAVYLIALIIVIIWIIICGNDGTFENWRTLEIVLFIALVIKLAVMISNNDFAYVVLRHTTQIIPADEGEKIEVSTMEVIDTDLIDKTLLESGIFEKKKVRRRIADKVYDAIIFIWIVGLTAYSAFQVGTMS